MQISSLRSSSANCYENCPHQYFLNYCIGFESIPNKKAELGTLVHRCAEILARSKKNNHLKNKDKCSDPNFVLDIVWNKLTRKNQHNFVFSDDDKQFCREQLQNIINSEYNPLKLNPIATEIQFEIEIRRPEFKYDFVDFKTLKKTSGYMLLRGTIDLLIKKNNTTIGAQDYKTGKREHWITGKLKEQEDFQKDVQLRIYDVAIKTLFPNYKRYEHTIFFTQESKGFTVNFSKSEYNDTINHLSQLFNKIQSDNKITRLIDDPTRKREHFKCNHVCQFGKVRHIYMDLDGDVLEKDFKSNVVCPDYIEVDNKIYFRHTFHDETMCYEYHRFLKHHGIFDGSKKLYDISINNQYVVSKRNDYNNTKIIRGIIE
jgi:RecB family exonuclease